MNPFNEIPLPLNKWESRLRQDSSLSKREAGRDFETSAY